MNRRNFLKGFTALVAVASNPPILKINSVIEFDNEYLIRQNLWSEPFKRAIMSDLSCFRFNNLLGELYDEETEANPSETDTSVQEASQGQEDGRTSSHSPA